MRIKNFTLLFLLGLFSLTAFKAQAQTEATIDPANIHYWIGEGENQLIFAVNWNHPDTCLAWGYRFSEESVLVKDVMDAIVAEDQRFGYTLGAWGVGDITFNSDDLHLALVGNYWLYNIDGVSAGLGYDSQTVVNGNFIKWGDESCAVEVNPETYSYVWIKEVVGVYPLADEAVIDPSEIRNWVGEGENEVIFAVNWNNPDTCLAWGYRFSNPAVLVKEVMDAIAEKDKRCAYVVGDWGVSDITYNTGDLHLALTGLYWMYNINGFLAGYGYDSQPVKDGDFIKWGDESCGTEIAPWTYVWEAPVTPVTNNTNVEENAAEFSVYPNPAATYTMVDMMGEQGEVTVSDLQGRVLRVYHVDANAEPLRVETEGYEAGLYFVTLRHAQGSQTVKLVVK